MSDLWTMIWKEGKDLIFRDKWWGLLLYALFIGILGILLPSLVGPQWLELPAGSMLLVVYIPFTFISSFIGDAIAGERERHTLETLLATRMPDRVILLGKVIATVGFAWGMAVVSLLLGAIWVNLLHGSWMFYHPFDLFLEWLALALVVILLAANAGVLISLRVATVRQAQQILQVGVLVLVIASLLILRTLPENLISSLSYSQLMLAAIAVIAILDAILLGLALLSFQRSRLILS